VSRTKLHNLKVPGFFLPHIEALVLECGGSIESLYSKAGIEHRRYGLDDEGLSEDQFFRFVSEAAVQTNEADFGLKIGRRLTLGSFGLLSKAIMSCANLGAALQLMERYSVLVMPLLRITSVQTERHVIFELDAASRYAELNTIILEALISCIGNIGRMLLGRDLEIQKLTLKLSPPDNLSAYPMSFSNRIIFSADRNAIYVAPEILSLPFITANPVDAQTSRAQCEAELLKSQASSKLKEEVTHQIRYYLDKNPSETFIAEQLNLSARSLRRKLALDETHYRGLLKSVREDMAFYYLRQTELQVAQIAQKLGYQETSNFRAAFKKWTGKSPRQWRQHLERKV
jgi:AraC-like DNA-binding protein